MVNITDNGITIKLLGTSGAKSYNEELNKTTLSVTKVFVGTDPYIAFYTGGNYINSIIYVDVSLPVSANIDDLISQIQAMLASGVGGATEATQLDILASIDEIKLGLIPATYYNGNFPLLAWSGAMTGWKILEGYCNFPNYPYGNDLYTLYNGSKYLATATYPFPSADVLMEVSSTSSDDTALSVTGAKTVYIEGYLLDGTFQTEVVTLDGKNPVSTINSYYRITNFVVATAATVDGNLGRIYIGTGTVDVNGVNDEPVAMIDVGESSSTNAVVHVPEGMNYLVNKVEFHAVSLQAENQEVPARFQLWMKNEGGLNRLIYDFYGKDKILGPIYGLPASQDGPLDFYIKGGAIDDMDTTVVLSGLIELILFTP